MNEDKMSDIKEVKTDLFDDKTNQINFLAKENPHQRLANLLGEEYIEYRKKWMQAGDCEDILDYPIHLDFTTNESCNLKCSNCPFSLPVNERPYKPAKGTIPLDLFEKIIKDGYSKGLRSIGFGAACEPLINKDILNYIKIAKDAGIIDIILFTNALAMTPEIIEGLIDNGVTWLNVSLDAITEKSYNYTRIGGDFNKTLSNINNFLKIRAEKKMETPLLRVSFVKMKHNIKELNDFVEHWSDKADTISLQTLLNVHYNTKNEKEFEKNLKIEDVIETEETNKICTQPYQRLLIRNNGNISPCCNFIGYNIVLGNIFKDDISEIWNSKSFRDFRKSVNSECFDKKHKVCQDCFHTR